MYRPQSARVAGKQSVNSQKPQGKSTVSRDKQIDSSLTARSPDLVSGSLGQLIKGIQQ